MQTNPPAKKKTPWVTLVALAGIAFTASPSRGSTFGLGENAVTGTSIQSGDIILGVRDTSTTTPNTGVYLIDLGAPPSSPGTNLFTPGTLASIGTDLTNLYGSGWYTNTSLQWSVSGYEGVNTLVASKVEPTLGTEATAYSASAFGNATRNAISNLMGNVDTQLTAGSDTGYSAAGFAKGGYSTAGGAAFLNSDAQGYGIYMPGYNNSNLGVPFEADGFSGTALDMFTIAGTSPSNELYDGTFTVNASGSVIYSATPAAVPEPGRAGLLGLGMAGLLLRRRRKARPVTS